MTKSFMKLRDKTFEEWLAVHHERANPNLQTVHKVAFNAGWDAVAETIISLIERESVLDLTETIREKRNLAIDK